MRNQIPTHYRLEMADSATVEISIRKAKAVLALIRGNELDDWDGFYSSHQVIATGLDVVDDYLGKLESSFRKGIYLTENAFKTGTAQKLSHLEAERLTEADNA